MARRPDGIVCQHLWHLKLNYRIRSIASETVKIIEFAESSSFIWYDIRILNIPIHLQMLCPGICCVRSKWCQSEHAKCSKSQLLFKWKWKFKLQGASKKMLHSDFSLKSVPRVGFYFSRGVFESEFRARTTWAL